MSLFSLRTTAERFSNPPLLHTFKPSFPKDDRPQRISEGSLESPTILAQDLTRTTPHFQLALQLFCFPFTTRLSLAQHNRLLKLNSHAIQMTHERDPTLTTAPSTSLHQMSSFLLSPALSPSRHPDIAKALKQHLEKGKKSQDNDAYAGKQLQGNGDVQYFSLFVTEEQKARMKDMQP
ncbi:MAG: hypothetical protein Q9224_007157 [Gallowayella concinna]